jgi:hypothetical protein
MFAKPFLENMLEMRLEHVVGKGSALGRTKQISMLSFVLERLRLLTPLTVTSLLI